MNARRLRLLVCAFGPFPGVPVNPARLAVADMLRLRRPALSEMDIQILLLDTRWDALAGLGDELDRLSPDGVLLFGVAARRKRVCVEALAVNAARSVPDAARRHPRGRHLSKDGPERLASTAPASALAGVLRRAGLPARASRDAGRYLCNASLFNALQWARGRPAPYPPVVFVHLPGKNGRPPGVSRRALARGLCALTAAFVAQVRRTKRSRLRPVSTAACP